MSKSLLSTLEPNVLRKSYLTTIDLADFGEEPLTVRLRMFKIDDSWKSGWYFEGVVLEPSTNVDSRDEMAEEEEVKREEVLHKA